jgi:zinc and cadmium transporter
MELWIYAVVSVGFVSAIPLVGLLLARARPAVIGRVILPLVSFAVGALLGGAFFHLVPEAVARIGSGPVMSAWLLAGFIGFFALEQFLWVHEHSGGSHNRGVSPVATLNLLGDGLHNLIDGAVIAASYSAGTGVGLAATAAVFLHEIPQELGDFGVLVYSGLPVRRAVWFNFLSGLAALLGAGLTLLIGRASAGFTDALLPVAAGMFLYIAASDLIPELRRDRQAGSAVRQLGLVLLGASVMALPLLLE